MNPKQPSFDGRPIGSVASLAAALGVPIERLRRFSGENRRFYCGPIMLKRTGKKDRIVWAAIPELRDLQQRVLDRILKRGHFPDYLQGGLTGRGYQGNARRHTSAKILFGQDVSAFYDAISATRVTAIFLHVFHFPLVVAELLASLCCRNRQLVQGGVASTHLANLSLFRTEPSLEAVLAGNGVRYTRFVDDLHASAPHRLTHAQITDVVREMRGALEREGFAPKRAKQFVATARDVMRVHGLNVNGIVSSPTERRRRLRNEVFLLERWAAMECWNTPLERCYLRLCSTVGALAQTNAGDARRLKMRLNGLSKYRLVAIAS
jgi:hypothetical protein